MPIGDGLSQSELYYALRGSYLTKKKAKIILYSKIGEKSNQFKRLREVIQFHKLTVDLEVIQSLRV